MICGSSDPPESENIKVRKICVSAFIIIMIINAETTLFLERFL